MPRIYVVMDYTDGVPDLPRTVQGEIAAAGWNACAPTSGPTVIGMVITTAGVITAMKAATDRYLWLADTASHTISDGSLGATEAADAAAYLSDHGYSDRPAALTLISNSTTRFQLVNRIAALHDAAWTRARIEENRLG